MNPVRVMQIVAAPLAVPGKPIGVNGPERRFANVVGKWQDYGVLPIVVYPRRGRMWSQFENHHVPLIDYEIKSKFDFVAINKFKQIARRFGAEVIHTQGPPSLDAIACRAAKKTGVPILMTRPVMIENRLTMNYKTGNYVKNYIYYLFDHTTRTNVDKIIAVCMDGQKHLVERNNVSADKTVVIYNGIDLNKFISKTRMVNPENNVNGPIILGMVAQITPQKGWVDFINVLTELKRKFHNIKGIAVGDGPLRRYIEDHAKRLQMTDVIHFAGYQENVSDFLRQMDIFLFISRAEGLPVAVIEAMASGLPVVATDVGGVKELVVENKNGFVVPVGDHEGLVDRCTKLIESPVLRERFGQSSRDRAETLFSEDAMVRGYSECYREAVSGSGRTRREDKK